MNAVKDTFRALVKRRLWPLALLLVAALVAVPVLLAKQPETDAPAAAPAASAKAEDTSTFVSLADDTQATERRRVLGPAKDPFEPKALPKASKASSSKAAKKTAAKKTTKDSSTSSSSTGAGNPGSAAPVATATPVPTATPTPAPKVPQYSIRVRIGETDGEKATKTVQRLAVLPSASAPVLIYRGIEEGGKVAVFELTGDVTAQGDGTCEPTPEDCEVLKLHAGETEFIDVTGTEGNDAQYEIDLEKLYVKTTTVAASSKLAKASSVGRALLDEWTADRRTRYAFDAASGTLHKVRVKQASKLTRAAKRAAL